MFFVMYKMVMFNVIFFFDLVLFKYILFDDIIDWIICCMKYCLLLFVVDLFGNLFLLSFVVFFKSVFCFCVVLFWFLKYLLR